MENALFVQRQEQILAAQMPTITMASAMAVIKQVPVKSGNAQLTMGDLLALHNHGHCVHTKGIKELQRQHDILKHEIDEQKKCVADLTIIVETIKTSGQEILDALNKL